MALFLPYGLFALVIGLCFTMAFVRNETDVKTRDIAVYVVGASGPDWPDRLHRRHDLPRFLLPYGVVLIPLGFVFLWAFIALRGIVDDLGYRAAYAVGAIGLVFFLIALGRSTLPPLLEKINVISAGYAPVYDAGRPAAHGRRAALRCPVGGLRLRPPDDRADPARAGRYSSRRWRTWYCSAYTALGWNIFLNFVFTCPVRHWAAPESCLGRSSGPSRWWRATSWPGSRAIAVLMLVPVLTMHRLSEEHSGPGRWK